MNWQAQLEMMGEEELYDLCGYLYGFDKIQGADHAQLLQMLLHGKRSRVFYLMDKDAYKTLRRLIRHPDRPLTYRYYPVDQLLELSMIEVVPHLDNDEVHGWYQIRKEALDFARRVSHTRYYDPLVFELQRQDEILMGLFHTYGLLELHQCVQMLSAYGIETEPRHLFSSITWRLAIREQLQAFQVRQHDDVISFIMLRGMDFVKAYQGIQQYSHIPYQLCEEKEMRRRKDRYYASELTQVKQLEDQLRKHFSRRFTKSIVEEMIDAYQYHTGEFTYEEMIYRVFETSEIRPFLYQAIAALPDQFRKGHSQNESCF